MTGLAAHGSALRGTHHFCSPSARLSTRTSRAWHGPRRGTPRAGQRSWTVRSVAAPQEREAPSGPQDIPPPSYNQLYTDVFTSAPTSINTKRTLPKPSNEAQGLEQGSRQVLLSDVWALPRTRWFSQRQWTSKDRTYAVFMIAMHGLACLAPATFTPQLAGGAFLMYLVSGLLGITTSYHRQLSHRSFRTPKWLEHALAYCGVLAIQGDPLEWVSCHRHHHLHCDTPLDPHSPYEGFWWSHMGWLLDDGATQRRIADRSNVADMADDPFYQHLAKHFGLHATAQLAALFALGGLPALVWVGAVRLVVVYHITWFVNSAAHVWGSQSYRTGDLSRNNWWVGLLAFGEGWHNNHHAFEFSARHGLEWWQIDATWLVIRGLQSIGLATNVKLPSEAQKAKLAL
ncbi:FAD5A [Auxenochlorella protothecoides x Auxenochlorella symbiontica]